MVLYQSCRTMNRSALSLVIVCLLSACSIVRTGIYSPIGTYSAVENKLPLTIRTIGVLQAGSAGNYFNEAELRRIEAELANSISNDMMKFGLFRPPLPKEKSYFLDVEFPELSLRASLGGFVLALLGGVTLGIPLLLGVPSAIYIHKGEAVFKLYSPEEVLVHETITYEEKSHVVGLYYGHSQSFGKLVAVLVSKFKTQLFDRINSIRANTPIASVYGKFKRIDPYNHLTANQIIMNSGPTQFNNLYDSKSPHIEQNSSSKSRRKITSRKKGNNI